MIDGARRWYDLDRRMPPPARVQADTLDWRTESDQVLAYLDDRIRFDPKRHVMTAELLEDLNDWLEARGHRPWSDKTLAARFGDHELIAHHHVERRKVRKSEGLSRPKGRYRDHAPATYNAWLGLRFATPQDQEKDLDKAEAAPTPDDIEPEADPNRDPFAHLVQDPHHTPDGGEDDQAAGGEDGPVTRDVPGVPANSKPDHVREDERVSENPEHPEQTGNADLIDDEDLVDDQLQDQLDAILDWLLDQDEHPDDPVRTLAHEVADDRQWSDDATTLDELVRYVGGHEHHDPRMLVALRRAWSLFTGQPVDDDESESEAEVLFESARPSCADCGGPTQVGVDPGPRSLGPHWVCTSDPSHGNAYRACRRIPKRDERGPCPNCGIVVTREAVA
jgi:hypothetical protein